MNIRDNFLMIFSIQKKSHPPLNVPSSCRVIPAQKPKKHDTHYFQTTPADCRHCTRHFYHPGSNPRPQRRCAGQKEDVRDRKENRRDRREDKRDKAEDRRDKREDVRDAQHDGGRRDKLEDVRDRKEDVRDKKEDRRDKAEDKRDRKENRRDRAENKVDRRTGPSRRG